MLLYLTIFAILLVFGLAEKSRGSSLYTSVLIGIFLLLFMGTRYETGCDFDGYLNRFLYIDTNIDLSGSLSFTEPGFHLLTLTVRKLGLDYMWLNIFASLIYILCLFRFSRISTKPLLLIALFFPILIIQLGMSGLRQALALGFLLVAFHDFTKRKQLMTAIWILVAAQFHASAYIFLPIALLVGKEVSFDRILVALAVLGPVAALLLQERVQVYSDRYVEQIYGENSSSGALFRYMVVFISSIFFEFHRKNMKAAFPYTYQLMSLFSLIGLALIPVALLSTVALHRLTFYVMPISLFTLVNVSLAITEARHAKFHPLAIPVLVMSIYMVGWFSMSKHASRCYIPYESYLVGNEY